MGDKLCRSRESTPDGSSPERSLQSRDLFEKRWMNKGKKKYKERKKRVGEVWRGCIRLKKNGKG